MGCGPSGLPVFAVVYDGAKTGPDLQRSKDPSDGFGYMPDIWDDPCGSRCHWTRCRAVRQQGLPVLLDDSCGVPITVEGLHDVCLLSIPEKTQVMQTLNSNGYPTAEGLHDVCLLSIPVRRRHADHVCSGEERASHSDLVRQRMVGVEVQIPVCVGLFLNMDVVEEPRWWTPTHATTRDVHLNRGVSDQRSPQ